MAAQVSDIAELILTPGHKLQRTSHLSHHAVMCEELVFTPKDRTRLAPDNRTLQHELDMSNSGALPHT